MKGDPLAELPDTKMITVEYFVPPSYSDGSEELNPAFETPKKSTQEILESYGVDFPKGTSAQLDRLTGKLRVTQTIDNVERIDAIVESIRGGVQKQIFIEVQIIAIPSKEAVEVVELTRGASMNHSGACEAALDQIRSGKATLVAAVQVMVRSGQRVKNQIGSEVLHIEGFDWNEEAGQLIPSFKTRNVGTIFEVDSVIGGDEMTIDLNFSIEHHFQPPTIETMKLALAEAVNQEFSLHHFHAEKILGQVTVLTGNSLMIGRVVDESFSHSETEETESVERLIFLSARIQYADENPHHRVIIEDDLKKEP